MATNPRTWIYGLLDVVPGFLSTPARYIADRVFGVLDDGVEFAVWIKSGVDYLRGKGIEFAKRVYMLSVDVYTTTRWLLVDEIPALIAAGASDLRKWATKAIDVALGPVRLLISTLDKWAKNAVSLVLQALSDFRDWAVGRINAVLDKLRKTVDVWYERLTDPKKFAAWVIGAIVLALFGYAYDNREKIMSWLLRSSPSFTAWLARELETMLRKLL